MTVDRLQCIAEDRLALRQFAAHREPLRTLTAEYERQARTTGGRAVSCDHVRRRLPPNERAEAIPQLRRRAADNGKATIIVRAPFGGRCT